MTDKPVLNEWSGSPDPSDPDNFWIDDETGERVNAHTGERTAAETGGEEEDYRFAKDRDEWRHEAIEAQKLK